MLACPVLQPINFVPLSQHTNAELCQEGEAIFKRFNNDSLYLDKFGIKCALTALHGAPPTKAQLYRVSTLAGSKGLDLRSWIDYVTEWKQTQSPREQSRETFRILDKSCSGFISRTDWHAVVKTVAPNIHPFVVDDAFDAVDSNRDGRIDCEEFVALMGAINIYH